jgi:hypothetical protein
MTFYACTGSPDFSESFDLALGYFRNNAFVGVLLPSNVTVGQHDIVAAVIRKKAETDIGLSSHLVATADRIQSDYTQSWADYHAWMKTEFGTARTRELAEKTFAAQVWRDRFDEVDSVSA